MSAFVMRTCVCKNDAHRPGSLPANIHRYFFRIFLRYTQQTDQIISTSILSTFIFYTSFPKG